MATALSSLSAIEMVRRTLLDTTAVSALVADRVLGAYPEQVDAGQATYPLAALVQRGGDLRRFARMEDVSFDLVAFSGESPAAAAEVYDACANALQAERITFADSGATGGERAAVAEEVARPGSGWDGGLRKWTFSGRWRVRVIG